MRTQFLLGIFLIVILLLACAPRVIPEEKTTLPEARTQTATKESWKVEWEKTLAMGRNEGKVEVWGGSAAQGLKDSISLFKEKFGIDLLITSASSRDLRPRIMQQRFNGLYILDVMLEGPSGLIGVLKQAGGLDPLEPLLILPEVVDPKLWFGGEINWADEGHYVFNYRISPTHMVAINTQMVTPGEIKSYYDLLNPKWKGKILMNDPRGSSGSGYTGFISMLYNKIVDEDFIRQLLAQNPQILKDEELQLTWLARGKYPVALWYSSGRMEKFLEAGVPIRPVEDIKEGTYAGSGGSSVGIVNRAPHPNAAKVLINWLLSREGQVMFQKSTGKQSARIDISTEGLEPYQLRKPGVKYLVKPDEKEEWILKEQQRYTELANQIFDPLFR